MFSNEVQSLHRNSVLSLIYLGIRYSNSDTLNYMHYIKTENLKITITSKIMLTAAFFVIQKLMNIIQTILGSLSLLRNNWNDQKSASREIHNAILSYSYDIYAGYDNCHYIHI